MFLERKQDLSVYHWLVDLFADASFINIVDDFPTQNLTIPTISIWTDTIEPEDFELGNRDGKQTRLWVIDIFASNKSQRDEYGYRILNELKNPIPVYNYDEGFPPDASPSLLGYLHTVQRRFKNIKVLSDLVEELFWRSTVTFVTLYSERTN